MNSRSLADQQQTLIVLAPSRADADALTELCSDAGLAVRVATDAEAVARAVESGEAGVALLTEKALASPSIRTLAAMLARQPDWSAPPLVLLTSDDAVAANAIATLRAEKPGLPVTVLLRPISRVAIVSALEVALHARTAQLAIRDLLASHREADDRATFLLNEMNHRVKNIYATVNAIAGQTMRSTRSDPDKFLEAFRGRIVALADVADLLGRGGWVNAELAEVVKRTLSPLLAEELERRVRLEGPLVTLNSRQSSTLGLILHELATNALKYGALSEDVGEVDVHWDIRNGELAFDWRESGGPGVRQPQSRGFGTNFIERAVQVDLGGVAALDFRPDGLRCSIRFAMAPAD